MLNNTYSIVFLTVSESGSNTENYTLESSVCALNIHFLICATAFLSLGFVTVPRIVIIKWMKLKLQYMYLRRIYKYLCNVI